MKLVIWLCTWTAVLKFTFPAPVEDEKQTGYHAYDKEQLEYLRNRRVNNNYYMTPCQAAASASSSLGYPQDYQNNFIPGQARFTPNSYGFAYPEYANLYRSDDPYRDDREIISYSDGNFMESGPSARFAKKIFPTAVVSPPIIAPQALSSFLPINAANLAGITGQLATQVGPAYGVFPNSNVGGCNVPLLFSCTPSIVPGRISQGGPHLVYPSNVIGASPVDFRGVDESQGIHPNLEDRHDNIPVKNSLAQLNEKH